MFQFTRPRGARRGPRWNMFTAWRVSIHAPTGGATALAAAFVGKIPFQFTRPRGARLHVHHVPG